MASWAATVAQTPGEHRRRQVDLADQQHEDDAERQDRRRDDLQREVRDVVRREVRRVLRVEVEPDQRERRSAPGCCGTGPLSPATEPRIGQSAHGRGRSLDVGVVIALSSTVSGSLVRSGDGGDQVAPTVYSPRPNSATLLPRRMTTTRSATSWTSFRSWEMTRTPRSCSLSRTMRSSTSVRCETPSAAVGSSSRTRLGSEISARQMAMPWRCPPDSPPTGVVSERILTARLSSSAARLRPPCGGGPAAGRAGRRRRPPGPGRRCAPRRGCRTATGPGRRCGCRRPGRARASPADRLTAHADLARVGVLDARDHLDQGRLPGAVVAHEARRPRPR